MGDVAKLSLTVVNVYNLLTGLGVEVFFVLIEAYVEFDLVFWYTDLFFSFSWLVRCAGLLRGDADGDLALD